ncbi:hypothetical protein Fmac_019225 [Flemingia macrophylla]|uniref:Uncharacterized protein n=1 Tax=Flemingia macrophylla TaxID=520843 RepID=A0ABD1M786_9FABA
MAHTTTVSILAALAILSNVFVTLQARNLHGHPLIGENADSHHHRHHDRFLIHKLGFKLSKDVHIHDADGDPKDANSHRLAPEGPDPHHNYSKKPPRI